MERIELTYRLVAILAILTVTLILININYFEKANERSVIGHTFLLVYILITFTPVPLEQKNIRRAFSWNVYSSLMALSVEKMRKR